MALESMAGETSQTVRTFHTWARTVNNRRPVHDNRRPVHDDRRSVYDNQRPIHDDRRGFILGRFISEGGTSIAGISYSPQTLNFNLEAMNDAFEGL